MASKGEESGAGGEDFKWRDVVNTTPHDVTIFDEDDDAIVLPSHPGHQLRLKEVYGKARTHRGVKIVGAPEYIGINGKIPDGPMIVSALVGARMTARKHVYGIDTGAGAVRNKKGEIIGSKRVVLFSKS